MSRDINININVGGAAESTTSTSPAQPGTSQITPTNTASGTPKTGTGQSIINMGVIGQITKQAANVAANVAGTVSRDSLVQQRISTGMSVVSSAAMIAANPLIGTIAVGVQLAIKAGTYSFQKSIDEQSTAILQRRAGINDRSR